MATNSPAAEMQPTLRHLQDETIGLTAPALYLAGAILILTAEQFENPLHAGLPAIVLLLLPLAIGQLRRISYLGAAWALVLGCVGAILALAVWQQEPALLCLLALPAGLAALFAGRAGGLLTVAAGSLLLFALPGAPILREVALVELWGTVGLIWLTLRPLLTTLQWSWSSYERSRTLLEQARDYQVQLKQSLADLAEANLQLTRLNRLTQALRQAAEEARRAKEEFVANVSHELRTPLNMVIGFSEMIIKAPQIYGAGIPDALLADLTVILRNSQHLSALIDDVLDLSQIEAGRMALTKERVGLPEIIEEAVTAVRPLYESKGLYLQVEVAPGLPSLFCDRTRIREVLLNLLSNAGRFTEQGGVRLRAWQEGNTLAVSVTDTGPGIAAKDKDRLFQPFQQLDGSIRRLHAGSGLGLAISKAFVELHGGHMDLESARGAGTTFTFRLPIDPPAPIPGGAARWLSPQWHYGEHIRQRAVGPHPVLRPRLVVLEQGDTLQRLVSRYLDDVEIAPVASLPEAFQELSRTPAQALLVNDPSVSQALQELDHATALPYGTPAIICSIPDIREATDHLGIADYLVKPISHEQLLGALDHLALRGKTVLIVDDEPEALQLFQRILVTSGRGYRVLRAADGVQAMEIMRRERPAAVLLDLVMPEMDGFHLLEARRSDPALRDIPVIVTSALDPAGQPIVSRALGLTHGGGLSLPQLLTCIQALIGILGTPGQAGNPAPPQKSAG